MTWVRLDDSMPEHPKIAALSDAAFRLNVEGLCYCGRTLSDGVIPTAIAKRLGTRRAAGELVDAGVWDETPAGYLIHDYSDYQPTRDQVLDGRRKTADRVARYRDRSNGVTPKPRNAVTNGAPIPSHRDTSANADVVEQDARRGDVDKVWSEYTAKHPRARLTQPRRGLIRRRLKDYPVDVLIAAVKGNHLDPHCNGDNPRGQTYHDLELILRDAAHIERYSGLVGPGETETELERACRWWVANADRGEDDLRGVWGDTIADQVLDQVGT